MKKYISIVATIVIAVSSLFMNGCSTTSTQLAQDTAADVSKFDEAVYNWLKNPVNQKNTEDGLILGGVQLLNALTKGDEKIAYANELYVSATAWNSLSTGSVISPDQVNNTIGAFNGKPSASMTQYNALANLSYRLVYNKLSSLPSDKYTDAALIAKQWAQVFANAARAVGAAYQTVEPAPSI